MGHDRLNVALITGAAGGIGAATARELHAAGFKLALWDVTGQFPAELADDAQHVLPQRVDVTDARQIDAALAAIRSRWGGVSVLINNAGISPKTSDGTGRGILTVSSDEWSRVLGINLTALLTLIQKTAPDMMAQAWGRIVNLSSQAARTRSTVPGVAYVCTKTAVLGLTRYAAEELGPHGITCNAVTPGRIASAMTASAGPEVTERLNSNTPLRRMGTPEEVAKAIAFFCAPSGDFVSGAVLDVNGGLFMQ
ncbi:SDR family oxidoreductase [Achromobacter mucicolens]|uniref:SDR family NAD(P)-dependent oxidoreductase n=1 Tax=Achromobacter mucicolens TaxID=1389922 RepID=UPI00244C2E8B|nr:SDR family NAD(P)-dependent oxidoreductase [Achromobacter mucicolens]MDH0090255.1 SDR family oxidoreductase [Achromobacter mucicolens]